MTDACPDTPRGVLVNDVGCPVKTVSVSLDLKFPTGKSELSAEFDPQLKKVADFMDRFPTVTLVIEGHTDNVGSAAKNKVLSQVRADSVKNALIKKFNVSADRVSSKGFGAESPVASNATAEGRAKNRRVVAVLSATE
jgi:OOP family OmpA-OmpF porin